MAIEAIAAIGAAGTTPVAATASAPTPGTDFAQLLGEGLSKVDSGLQVADQQLRALAAGKDVAVHDVMISMEQARMNLMFMVEVRNRVVEAYQELMRMQL
jgi:flagellar hook-basal body complex protein FliE